MREPRGKGGVIRYRRGGRSRSILLKNSDAAFRQCAEAMRWRTIFSRHRLVWPALPVLGGLIVEPSPAHAVLGAALVQSRVFQRNRSIAAALGSLRRT